MFLSPLIKSPSLSYTILFAYLIIVLLHVKTKSTQNVLFRTTKHQRKKNQKNKKKQKQKKKQKKSIYPNSPFKDSFCVFDAYMHLFIIYVIDLLHVKNPPKQFFSELPDTKKKNQKKTNKKK